MSFLEFLAIVAGWSAVIFVAVASWRSFNERRPRTAPPRARCQCGVCTGKVRVSTQGLVLTARQLTDIQVAVFAVGTGATKSMTLPFDYVNERGSGQLAIVVMDATLLRAVDPAIKWHLAATRSGT